MKVQIRKNSEEYKSVRTECGFSYRSTVAVVTDVVWEAETLEDVFFRLESENRKLRYCNGCSYELVYYRHIEEYKKWYANLSESVKMNLYYGNGTVD